MSQRVSSLFRLQYAVTAHIDAPPERVWALLTDAARFASWNSTVTSIEGSIAAGEKLVIRVPVSERTFTPSVKIFEPPRRMLWEDGMLPFFRGQRTFVVAPSQSGTRFEMVEEFRGAMLPMVKGSLPDFGPIFDRYVEDLRRAAERGEG
jgi:uncharacterized protein YndB with AHSA1/START domain